ncbi:MAG: hypothetical protein CFH35_00018 [Alphaproteobacteria bacterium MarineAlpha9_Bin5]|nr:MAG: hypothetical protein CFH36_00483 [Alphaproteobacteria bacterium MarineAlpha9_Bin6]PPR40237.1 MAG: hypothetical protein CFH35_00018 [Alphaproteobacteria bacterium MarineAlpha9_Bin5]
MGEIEPSDNDSNLYLLIAVRFPIKMVLTLPVLDRSAP